MDTWGWWLGGFVVLCVIATAWALWRAWRNDVRDIIIRHKADEFVNDEMQALRSRAETHYEGMTDRQRMEEFDKNFPGGSQP